MLKTLRAVSLSVLALFLVIGCHRPAPDLVLRPPQASPDWFDPWPLLAAHQLPAGFRWQAADEDRADLELRVHAAMAWETGLAATSEPTGKKAILTAQLAERWLGLALPYNHPRHGYSLAEVAGMELVPLEDIRPPLRAAPINRSLPGQADYPLIERVSLRVYADPALVSVADLSRLQAWLDSLPTAALPPVQLLGAVGDIVIEPPGQAALAEAGWDIAVLLRDTLPVLRSHDLLLANLEGPVSDRGEGNPVKRFQFRHRPEVLPALLTAGFDYFTFANNHTLDFGQDAFLDTLDHLDASGVAWSGAGRNLAEALRPASLQAGDTRLAIFGYAQFPVESRGFKPADAAAGPDSPGILTNADILRAAITEAAADGRFVVVLPHAGYEYIQRPAAFIKSLYRSFVDAGASLVLGSHPHVLQGLEAWGEGVIAYSLGNFLFTQLDEPPVAQKSAIFTFVLFEGGLRGYGLTPVLALDDYTELDPDVDGALETLVRLNQLIGD